MAFGRPNERLCLLDLFPVVMVAGADSLSFVVVCNGAFLCTLPCDGDSGGHTG